MAGMAAVILQWLHRAGWTARQRRVACAHPTRLATVTAATSAADDCGLRVGAAIGYSIPFEEVASPVGIALLQRTNHMSKAGTV